MTTYQKGTRAEHELIDYFDQNGFCVIRAAGSGVSSLSPDILVFKRGLQYAIEAKANSEIKTSIGCKQCFFIKQPPHAMVNYL